MRRKCRPRGKPIVERGTLPTPADPTPSNQVIYRYRDGRYDVTIPPATPTVIAEYEAAISDSPDDAGLHMHFAFSLLAAGEKESSFFHAREAARLKPDWAWPHSFKANVLGFAGRLDEAVVESREALRLILAPSDRSEYAESCARFSLGKHLLRRGDNEDARNELTRALELQREAESKAQGNRRLLSDIEAAIIKTGS
jgi:Flp pilus assembly protein TadD